MRGRSRRIGRGGRGGINTCVEVGASRICAELLDEALGRETG